MSVIRHIGVSAFRCDVHSFVFETTLITKMAENSMEKRFTHCLSLAFPINRWFFTRYVFCWVFFRLRNWRFCANTKTNCTNTHKNTPNKAMLVQFCKARQKREEKSKINTFHCCFWHFCVTWMSHKKQRVRHGGVHLRLSTLFSKCEKM